MRLEHNILVITWDYSYTSATVTGAGSRTRVQMINKLLSGVLWAILAVPHCARVVDAVQWADVTKIRLSFQTDLNNSTTSDKTGTCRNIAIHLNGIMGRTLNIARQSSREQDLYTLYHVRND